MAPQRIGAANLRNAEGDPGVIDLAGERIGNQYSKTLLDNQDAETVSLDFLRRRFVRRKVHCGPELAAYLAAMAFGEVRR